MEYRQDQTGANSRVFALLLSYALVAVLAFVSGMAFGADNGARVDRAELHSVWPSIHVQSLAVPPVYCEPRQSLGISLFFPLDLHQREERPRR